MENRIPSFDEFTSQTNMQSTTVEESAATIVLEKALKDTTQMLYNLEKAGITGNVIEAVKNLQSAIQDYF